MPSVDESVLGGGGNASIVAVFGILLEGGVAGGGIGGFRFGFCSSESARDLSVDGSDLAVLLFSFDLFSDLLSPFLLTCAL